MNVIQMPGKIIVVAYYMIVKSRLPQAGANLLTYFFCPPRNVAFDSRHDSAEISVTNEREHPVKMIGKNNMSNMLV